MDIAKYIKTYTDTNPTDLGEASQEYSQVHALRFFQSFNWIKDHLFSDMTILELGGSGLFSFILKDMVPGVKITNTSTDLRFPLEQSTSSFDLVLNMEVIEHIKDREPHPDSETYIWEVSGFVLNGVHNLLSQCNRVLRAGGLMFLTTPNVNSLDNIHRIINYLPPLNYYPHVREYSIGELSLLAQKNGFKVIKTETFFNWNEYSPNVRQEILSLLEKNGLSTHNRGDDIFMLLEKIGN